MTKDLNLSEILDARWLPYLENTISSLPDAQKYLTSSRRRMFPKLENTFKALELTSPEDCTVVIFGQDPYPREESAIGISFCDGAIRRWSDPTCPSLRNIFKNLLIDAGKLNAKSKVEDLRKAMINLKMVPPYQWFFEVAKQGVLWLNTSLTFTSNVFYFSLLIFSSYIFICLLSSSLYSFT